MVRGFFEIKEMFEGEKAKEKRLRGCFEKNERM